MDALRVLGADVRPVPAVPFDDPENYNHQVRIVVALTNGFICRLFPLSLQVVLMCDLSTSCPSCRVKGRTCLRSG